MLERGAFQKYVLGVEDTKSSRMSGTPGLFVFWSAPRSKGSGWKPRRALVAVWLRKQMRQKTADKGKSLARKTSDLLFQANKSKTERLPLPSCPREWGRGQLEEEPTERTYCKGGGGHGSWGPTGVCILHASGSAPAFISHFLIFKDITISLLG